MRRCCSSQRASPCAGSTHERAGPLPSAHSPAARSAEGRTPRVGPLPSAYSPAARSAEGNVMSAVRINLLPHREQKRAAKKREFIFVAAGTFIFAVAGALLIHAVLAGMVEAQQNKNKFLKAEIAKVDKEIEEIQRLKEQTAALLARKQVVETLQANRTEAVHLLDQLVRQ